MTAHPTIRLDDATRQQIVAQCNAVVHLATVLARIYATHARLFAKPSARDDLANIMGNESARLMEQLGDILNGMDAVLEEDERRLTPVFEEAHRRWPQNRAQGAQGDEHGTRGGG